MNQASKAVQFAELHRKGDPVILFNAWDPGSARAVAEAGAKAIATGSWSVAAANGYADGEDLPMDLAIANLERVVRAVELPVTLDFEGGYAADGGGLRKNIGRVIEAGAVGINFEDRVVKGEGIYDIETQSERIAAIRGAADDHDIPLFINARTDLYLKTEPAEHDAALLEEAVARAKAYAAAGASGFFAPGMWKETDIRTLCKESPLPVNILVWKGVPTARELANYGVARVSHGPLPYKEAMQNLTEAARKAINY